MCGNPEHLKIIESEEKYRSIVELASEIIIVVQGDKIVFANNYASIIIGHTTEEIYSMKFLDFVHPDDKILVTENYIKGMAGEVIPEHTFRLVHKDGTCKWVRRNGLIVKVWNGTGKPAAYVFLTDVTDLKQSEYKLKESEEKYRTLIEKANEGIMIAQEGVFAYINPKMEELTGYSHDELIGKPFADFIHPDDVNMVKRRYDMRISGDIISDNYTFRIINKNGEIRTLQLSAKRILWNNIPATLNLFTDVTEQKRLEENVIRLEKMEALGIMAGGVAHDLNNVLSVITGYAQLLLLKATNPDIIATDVKNILDASFRAACIVDDLIVTARRSINTEKIININDVIADVITSGEFNKIKTIRPMLNLKTDLKSELNILGSPLHLHKAMVNLINNAVESMKHDKNDLTITTSDRHLYKPVSGYDEIVVGDYVVVTVSDTGEGISEKDLPKVFEPFYTKKVMGKSGTGLGLSVVWGAVKDHNGYIDVKSELGVGSTFTLYFPVSRKELYEDKLPESTKWYMGSGQSILIVDDIEEQRELANIILTKMNYKTKVLPSGEAAIDYIKENSADMIILDMDMEPGIDGLETFKRIVETNPEQKVIIISGVIESEKVMDTLKLGACGFVKKPFRLEHLALQVYKLLNGLQTS